MNIVDDMHAIAAALDGAGIAYAICGGLAVTIHGAPRSTEDIDILIAAADVPRALEAVRPLGYAIPALPMVFEYGTPRERHVQRVNKLVGRDHRILDLILADSVFEGALDDRVEVPYPHGKLSVVSRATLEHMKRLANRPQDVADLERLKARDE